MSKEGSSWRLAQICISKTEYKKDATALLLPPEYQFIKQWNKKNPEKQIRISKRSQFLNFLIKKNKHPLKYLNQ